MSPICCCEDTHDDGPDHLLPEAPWYWHLIYERGFAVLALLGGLWIVFREHLGLSPRAVDMPFAVIVGTGLVVVMYTIFWKEKANRATDLAVFWAMTIFALWLPYYFWPL